MAAQSPRPYILDLANEPEESLRFYCVVSLRLSCPFSSGAKLEIFEKEWDTHSLIEGWRGTDYHENEIKIKNIYIYIYILNFST